MPVKSNEDCHPSNPDSDGSETSAQRQYVLPCSESFHEGRRQIDVDLGRLILFHEGGDPAGVNRIRVESGQLEVEILPSKGFSLGGATFGGKPFFWDPPLEVLPDPTVIDPEAPLLVGGSLAEGFGWIRGFTGGVEMLGPLNWGMPIRTLQGRLLGLHGAAANIPVPEAVVQIRGEELGLSARFEVRDRVKRPGSEKLPWYQTGEPIYSITKDLVFRRGQPGFVVRDEIVNLTSSPLVPDWGYHIQLYPQPQARYLVPSRKRRYRGGIKLDRDHELWRPVPAGSARLERGVINRQVVQKPYVLDGDPGVPTLLLYPDGSGIEVILPPVPYMMSWFSSGGAGSNEFMIPDFDAANGQPERILNKAWNGVGLEIGASALDHDDDIDETIGLNPLYPGESMSIKMRFCRLGASEATERAREIHASSNSG